MSESRDRWKVDDALSLLLRVSRLYGSAPVRFCYAPNGTFVRFSRPVYFYGIILICLINISYIYVITRNVYEKANKYYLNYLDYVYHYIIAMMLRGLPLVWITYSSDSKIKTFLWCYSNIRQIKTTITDNITSGNANQIMKKWKVILLLVFFILGIILLMGLTKWMSFVFYDFEMLFMIVIFNKWILLKLQFCTLVSYTNTAFKDINKHLKDILHQLCDDSIDDDQRTELASKIYWLSEAFGSSCNVMKKIISTESFYLFFYIVYVTMRVESNIFNLVKLHHAPDHSQTELALQYAWGIFHILTILLILEPCHSAHEELSSTRLLVGQVMCHPNATGKPLFEASNVFYKQLILNDISYSALGIFTIDRSILSVIVGAATTIFLIFKNLRSYWHFD